MPETALITGGGGGLGGAVTQRFLDDGWRVVVPWVDPAEPDRLPPHASLTLVPADLLDRPAVDRVIAAADADQEAPLRAVINLVGGYAAPGRVHEVDRAEFEAQFALNVYTAYQVCHAALPSLLRGGGGSIVCMSSRAAVAPFPGAAGYVAAKAAVLALVDALAVEYKAESIRANAVLPGVIDTPANRAAQPDADRSRWVPPGRIAEVILFLAGDASAPISGAHLPVYGRS